MWGVDEGTWLGVTALAAAATALIYVALGVFAWRQLREARRLREEQTREARQLQEDQTRPFVVVDFDFSGTLFFLVIENLGPTLARNVAIRFDKPLTRSSRLAGNLDEARLFREPIPALPPGKRIRVPFDRIPWRREEGLPLAYEVTLRYSGPTGKKYGKDEGYRLDMGIYEVAAAGQKGLHELVGEVGEIRQELQQWRRGRGPVVRTLDERQEKRLEARRLDMGVLRSLGAKALGRRLWARALERLGVD